MGLNIGIKITCNQRGYPFDPQNPTEEDLSELRDKFSEFLRQRFPAKDDESHGFNCSIYLDKEKDIYDYDVRMHRYCRKFNDNGYEQADMYKAIFDFALDNTPRVYDWDMHLYWNG